MDDLQKWKEIKAIRRDIEATTDTLSVVAHKTNYIAVCLRCLKSTNMPSTNTPTVTNRILWNTWWY